MPPTFTSPRSAALPERDARDANHPLPAADLLAAARQRARVAVVTRTKDRPLMLRRCMESVISQSFHDWLHVIVNDGGNPHVLNLLVAEHAARYRGRVQVIHNATSLGMQNASNIGVRAACGEFLVIHDDDDSWQPEFLRECVAFLDDKGADSIVQGVVTQTTRVLEEINAAGGIDEFAREDYIPLKCIDLFAAGADNPFAPIAFVYRRAVHERVGLFDERFSVVGDWDFNLRFLVHYEIGVIEQRLANYHWRHKSGGSVYANTVTDALDVHHQKSTELRNHYLRADLQDGRLGMGYLLNAAKLLRGHSALLWDVRNRGDQAIHEVGKVQSRLRHWEWLFTRNPRLKGPPKPGKPPRKARRRTAEAPGRDCRTELAALLAGGAAGAERCRVLSVDVFDTALLRVVRQPVDVFMFMEAAVRARLGEAELPVSALRISAEKQARQRQSARAGHEEVTLEEIYQSFCELAAIDPAAHLDALMALEIDAETRLLYGNPPILAACAAAARAGMRVVFASDMYLPRAFIVATLQRGGYALDGDESLFLSNERGASKHVGDLYDVMLRELDCAPGEIVHVGDNFHSDLQQAKTRGLRAVHWQPAATPDDPPLIDQPPEGGAPAAFADGDLLSSLCIGAVRRRHALRPAADVTHVGASINGNGNGAAASNGSHQNGHGSNGHAAATAAFDAARSDDLWDRLGYEIGGPLYFLFLHWLLGQAREEGIDRLYFLARDGYHLREACEILTARAGLPVESIYMAASRRLLNLPQVTALDHAALQFLHTPNPNLSVRHFFSRIGIDPAPLADKIRRAGFPSLDEVITTPGGVFRSEADHRNIRALLLSLEPELLAQAAGERARLLAYFRQIAFVPGGEEKMAVVDVGWQASSARALQTLLNLPPEGVQPVNGSHAPGDGADRARSGAEADVVLPHRLRAFYFGTWNFARPTVEAGCRLSSFFFHLDKPHSRCHLVSESVELIELFFGAPHPTIVGLREGADGRLETVHGECELGAAESLERLTRMRERAVEFVRDLAALAPERVGEADPGAAGLLDWSGTGINYLENVLERLLRRPTADEARQLGALPARDSFGGSSPTRPLARPPGSWESLLHPQRLQSAYQHAFWKKGFLAQLSPRAAAKLGVQ